MVQGVDVGRLGGTRTWKHARAYRRPWLLLFYQFLLLFAALDLSQKRIGREIKIMESLSLGVIAGVVCKAFFFSFLFSPIFTLF